MNVRSVERAVDLIETMVRAGPDLTLRDLSVAVRAPKSTTLNILRTLTSRNVFEFDPVTKRYRPGAMLMALANRETTKPELRSLVRPQLEDLAQRTGESVFLSVLDGYEITYIDKIDSQQPIRYIARVGTRRPLHCTSVGKLSLAMMEDKFLEDFLAKFELTRHTPKTITDAAKLRSHLARIRRQGISVSAGEFIPDLMGIAAPIFGANGRFIAALNVAGPLFRMERHQDAIIEALQGAVRQLPIPQSAAPSTKRRKAA